MDTELRAVQTLLERGVKVQIVAPLLFRIFGKRFLNFKITQPGLGTYYRISALFLATGLNVETLTGENPHQLFVKHSKAISRIVATAIINSWLLNGLLVRPLATLLFWKLTPQKLLLITEILVAYSSTKDFTNTIRLIANMKVTSPNLSQAIQGS